MEAQNIISRQNMLNNTATIEQARFIKTDVSTGVAYADAGEIAEGVSEYNTGYVSPYPANMATDGSAVPAVKGIVIIEAGGTVAVGGLITSDSDGKAVTATAGDIVKGIARTAGGDGDLIAINTEITTYIIGS